MANVVAERIIQLEQDKAQLIQAIQGILQNAVWSGKMGLRGISDAEALVPHPVLEYARDTVLQVTEV